MNEFVIKNAHIVCPDESFMGHVYIANGIIKDLSKGNYTGNSAFDLNKDFLIPGLIELHTDNIERHLTPRPKVEWPIINALLAHDRELSSVGITTVFDALRVGSIPKGNLQGEYKKYAKATADQISNLKKNKLFKIDHYIHLRAETASETLANELDEFDESSNVKMISIMDHTPGQRQFRNTDKYKEYLAGKYQLSDEEMESHFSKLKALQSKNSEIHIKKISEAQMRFQCVLASHDDTTIEDVLSSKNLGVSIAEFPTTIEAAKESQKEDMKIIMGSPNLMRGGSHSGNISAQELIDENCLDIFSSDYIPSSLLSSAVKWGLESGNMPKAIASISRNPAIATQLLDRGSIQCGMKADLVSFSIYNNLPIVKKVWVSGQAI